MRNKSRTRPQIMPHPDKEPSDHMRSTQIRFTTRPMKTRVLALTSVRRARGVETSNVLPTTLKLQPQTVGTLIFLRPFRTQGFPDAEWKSVVNYASMAAAPSHRLSLLNKFQAVYIRVVSLL